MTTDEMVENLQQLNEDVRAGKKQVLNLKSLEEMRVGGDYVPPSKMSLAQRFLIPPFSVLDARQGYWQARKRAWIALGIKSELGRGNTSSTSARVGPEDEATYSPIGGKKADATAIHDHEWQARVLGKVQAAQTDGVKKRLSAAPDGSALPHDEGQSEYVPRDKKETTLGAVPPNERSSIDRSGSYSTKKLNASPGGSPVAATKLGSDGKTLRGDGVGRPLAVTYGSGGPGDLSKGFRETASLKDGLTVDISCGAYRKAGEEASAASAASGTSIFDPVVCELAYRWFCPPSGVVLDPFAGGSVRGIVAAKLGRHYTGIDLSAVQLEANREQAKVITPDNEPTWIEGDSRHIEALAKGVEPDLVFGCPPYGSLERYSDHEADISTLSHPEFLIAYLDIIVASVRMLKKDRFACFVVGDFRDENGIYRNFISDTIQYFEAAGARLYNSAILVTAVGSLPIRVGKQFTATRKLGTTHQHVLVFVKGDPRKATEACGDVDIGDSKGVFDATDNNGEQSPDVC